MARPNFPKLIAIVLFCVVLALLLGAQALSSVATRSSPEQSVNLFPVNGLAHEQLAHKRFQSRAADGESVSEAAQNAEPLALRGLEIDPLAPKSYALAILAAADLQRQRDIAGFANRLNRRDLNLQNVILQQRVQDGDYPGTVETLNQILRAHPNYAEDFYPALVDALRLPETAPMFPGILTGESPWHEQFLRFAARDAQARINLATIRADIPISDEEFDRNLIRGLVQQGEVGTAFRLYQMARNSTDNGATAGAQIWSSQYPPFDWDLRDEGDFRAQASRDGRMLEIYARSGQGGLIARRVFAALPAPFAIGTDLDWRGGRGSDNVRLVARCASDQTILADVALIAGPNAVPIETLPPQCEQIAVEILARSMRGEPTLRAELSEIKLSRN